MPLEAEHPPADSARLRQLVELHYSSIYGYAYRLSGSTAGAEDLTQQTFMIAQQKLYQVREENKVDRWLYTIARTCFLKSRRRKRPSAAVNFELNVDEIPQQLPEDSPFDEELLQQGLDQLGDEFRIVVTMFYFDELSYKEIAEQLGIPIGTVMSRLARAKGRLRHALVDPDHAAAHGSQHASISPNMQS